MAALEVVQQRSKVFQEVCSLMKRGWAFPPLLRQQLKPTFQEDKPRTFSLQISRKLGS